MEKHCRVTRWFHAAKPTGVEARVKYVLQYNLRVKYLISEWCYLLYWLYLRDFAFSGHSGVVRVTCGRSVHIHMPLKKSSITPNPPRD